jgi:aspartate racemase
MTIPAAEHIPHIGIIAGTAEGAALCYRTLCHEAEQVMGRHTHPEITMHQLPLKDYLTCIDGGNWAGVAALMTRSASVLTQAGAELIICPNNTLHRAFDAIVSPLPRLHIADAVAHEAARSHYRRVGLLGTETVAQGSVYQPILEQRGIDVLVPQCHQQRLLNRIIRTELIRGEYSQGSRAQVSGIVASLASRGAEAVILGCTELPLLLQEERPALPLLDSTRILAVAALERVIRRPWHIDSIRAAYFTLN